MTNTLTVEYKFKNADGNTSDIVAVISNQATNDTGFGLAYDVISISGTFDGKTISGMLGNSGENQSNFSVGEWDNAIFTADDQGLYGTSFDGIDPAGIAFTTTDGEEYGVYTQSGSFGYQTNGNFGNSLTLEAYTPPCYCPGTHIRTPGGETAVEALEIGDLVLTASGEARPVKWIGRRAYSARFARNNANLHPVCFRAGSIADNVPDRDLWVSPEHGMFLHGVLIPAGLLVNGTTIVQPAPSGEVRYYHVELESHDLLIANGAAAESFLDDDSRALFHNAGEYAALYPEEKLAAIYCAPRVEAGEALEAALRRLAERARRAA